MKHTVNVILNILVIIACCLSIYAVTTRSKEDIKQKEIVYELYYKSLCDEYIPDSTYCKIRENNLEITYEEIWDKYRALSK